MDKYFLEALISELQGIKQNFETFEIPEEGIESPYDETGEFEVECPRCTYEFRTKVDEYYFGLEKGIIPTVRCLYAVISELERMRQLGHCYLNGMEIGDGKGEV